MGVSPYYKFKINDQFHELSAFWNCEFTFTKISTAKRTLILQDTPKRCLVLQVNKKVKEIPKVLLGRSQVQVLVFMLWLTLCSFNFKNLTKISISLLSRLMIRIIEDYFYKIGLKKVTFPSDPKIQRMKEEFELERWRKNPAHRNVKSIKSGLPEMIIQTDILTKGRGASCQWTLTGDAHWKNSEKSSMFQNLERWK